MATIKQQCSLGIGYDFIVLYDDGTMELLGIEANNTGKSAIRVQIYSPKKADINIDSGGSLIITLPKGQRSKYELIDDPHNPGQKMIGGIEWRASLGV